MWATGIQDLRLNEAQFWGLTFPKFRALHERFLAVHEAAQKRVQLIGYYLATFQGATKQGGSRFTLEDFGLGDGTSGVSGDTPSLKDYLAGEERGRLMLEALARGEKNPFAPTPGVETQVEMMRQFAEVQNESI